MARGGQRWGAGRPGWHVKAEHCLQLDARRFQRENMLRFGSWAWQWRNSETGEGTSSSGITGGDHRITLDFKCGDEPVTQDINITRTACNYGGSRAWFNCPQCWRRVAKLYLRGSRFKCRHCQRIAYASQSEDLIGRGWRQQAKLEARLDKNWRRPKGMHQATRDKLLERIWRLEEIRDDALEAFIARLGFKW